MLGATRRRDHPLWPPRCAPRPVSAASADPGVVLATRGGEWAWVFSSTRRSSQPPVRGGRHGRHEQEGRAVPDNEQDGQVMGTCGSRTAQARSDVVYHTKFPVGSTDYASFIARRRQRPRSSSRRWCRRRRALWKQMKSLNYVPRSPSARSAATTAAGARRWARPRRDVVAGYWSKSLGCEDDELVPRSSRRPATTRTLDDRRRLLGGRDRMGRPRPRRLDRPHEDQAGWPRSTRLPGRAHKHRARPLRVGSAHSSVSRDEEKVSIPEGRRAGAAGPGRGLLG